MKKSQHQHLKQVLKSLPHNYYKAMDVWKYCNSIAIKSKKYAKLIESPEQIISYVMAKTEKPKGRESWDYMMIDDAFCISFIKPISKHNIPTKVALSVLID